jgi:hypothetical protein
MRLISLLALAAVLLVGCQAQPKSTAAAAPVAAAGAAAKPKIIVALSDQKTIYECPNCGMDFDGAGKCSMCDVDLVKTDVAYICPADNKPVEHAGTCPRCNVNARVVKTAVATETPSGAGSGTSTPGTTGSGAPNGS